VHIIRINMWNGSKVAVVSLIYASLLPVYVVQIPLLA